jgi:hypothetical protein
MVSSEEVDEVDEEVQGVDDVEGVLESLEMW